MKQKDKQEAYIVSPVVILINRSSKKINGLNKAEIKPQKFFFPRCLRDRLPNNDRGKNVIIA